MSVTIHPSPNEAIFQNASPELPVRLSVGGPGKAKVFFGPSVSDAFDEVELTADKPLDIAQPVYIIGATRIVVQGIEPQKAHRGVAHDSAEADEIKVKAPKADKKAEEKVAEANENASIPSLSGDATPEPSDDGAAVKSAK